MPERDANQLAAEVRRGSMLRNRDAEAALDELVALVGTLQQELADAHTAHDKTGEEAEAAEAALAEMTAWRDEAEGLYRATAEHLRHSQGALATARQALTQITESKGSARALRFIAHDALADTGGDTA